MNEEFQGLSLVELIDLLEEVPEPPPIAMTPQTPGWIVVGVVGGLLLFFLFRWAWRRWKANAYRRAALSALDTATSPTEIAAIVRRTAMMAFPRADVAGLTGDRWLAFLDSTYPGSAFATGAGRSIITAPYRNEPYTPQLEGAARAWVRQHKATSKV